MALTGDSFDFVQGGVVTSSAQLVDAGATVGDVLTVQADGSLAAAPGGGSQPENVRRFDLGIVALADLFEDVTLYTPAEGELAGPLLIRDGIFLDAAVFDGAIQVTRPEQDIVAEPALPPMAVMDTDILRDSVGTGMNASAGAIVAITDGALVARVVKGDGINAELSEPSAIWEAARAYEEFYSIIGSDGHAWESSGGTSAGSEPDFAAHHGGTVADNDITWTDKGAAIGSFHAYLDVCSPAAP